MTRAYYKYAHGALIVFDLSRPETFDSALGWLSDVTEKLFDEREQHIVASAATPTGSTPSSASSRRDEARIYFLHFYC